MSVNVRKAIDAAERSLRELDAASEAFSNGQKETVELHIWKAAADAEYALLMFQLGGVVQLGSETRKHGKGSPFNPDFTHVDLAREKVKAGLRAYAESTNEEALAACLWEARGILMELQEAVYKRKT
ncbi:MAG: hypothetical protein ACE5PO_03540 [Candidatus Bathyarchaeia archaeon]